MVQVSIILLGFKQKEFQAKKAAQLLQIELLYVLENINLK